MQRLFLLILSVFISMSLPNLASCINYIPHERQLVNNVHQVKLTSSKKHYHNNSVQLSILVDRIDSSAPLPLPMSVLYFNEIDDELIPFVTDSLLLLFTPSLGQKIQSYAINNHYYFYHDCFSIRAPPVISLIS